MNNYIVIHNIDEENKKMEKIFEREKNINFILKNRDKYSKEDINNAIIENDIITSLKGVIDPELGINIFDLGLIYDFQIIGNKILIEYTLTTIGCPMGNYIEMSILENVNKNGDFEEVILKITFSPQWNIKSLPYETKLLLDML